MRLYLSSDGQDLTLELFTMETTGTLRVYNAEGQVGDDIAVTIVPSESGPATATAHVDLTVLDDYSLVWSIGEIEITQLCDLAQRPYFTADELRAFVSSTKTTLSETITDQDIEAILAHVEDVFDTAAGKSFCLRGKRETLMADGTQTYLVEETGVSEIVSCTIDGTAYDVASIHPVGMGMLYFDTLPSGSIALHYTYGDERETPSLKRNALMYAKSILGTSNLDPRATGAQNADYGFMRFTVAGKDGATGIPEVDAFLSPAPEMGGHGIRRLVFG